MLRYLDHTPVIDTVFGADGNEYPLSIEEQWSDEQLAAIGVYRFHLPDPKMAVPDAVELWQARAALREAGLFEQADALVQASGNAALKEFWEYASRISRASPALAALATALGLDADDLDDLFRQAAAITADVPAPPAP